jgi:hypothetical protein
LVVEYLQVLVVLPQIGNFVLELGGETLHFLVELEGGDGLHVEQLLVEKVIVVILVGSGVDGGGIDLGVHLEHLLDLLLALQPSLLFIVDDLLETEVGDGVLVLLNLLAVLQIQQTVLTHDHITLQTDAVLVLGIPLVSLSFVLGVPMAIRSEVLPGVLE